MKRIFSFIFILFVLTACQVTEDKQSLYQKELTDWEFKSEQDPSWREAEVPGVVHLDLLRHKVIENPFWGTQEEQLQWIGKKEWVYRTAFDKDNLDDFENAELVFKGLDTYADVYFNDSLILKADNMFREWRLDIKALLQAQNTLEIHFLPAEQMNEEKASVLSYKLPDIRVFTRKAPYQFGWDWGAKFVTAGIWKSAYIEAYNIAKIQKVQWEQTQVSASSAILKGKVQIASCQEQSLNLKISAENIVLNQDVKLQKGINTIKVEQRIDNPKLWYPRGLGEPYLYHLKTELFKDNTLLDSEQKSIGFRTIELVQDKDSIGQSFYFRVNGKPLFIKGANYVPQDNFLSRVDSSRYQKLIQSAVWANMNMLRVWGGGIYEEDIFYDLCDQNGILVWQDFMFACAMYPGDEAFLSNVETEITQQIQRLKHHPSIALWCGNNEVDNGWKDWGWQKQLGYFPKDSAQIWHDYQKLFHQLIPSLIARYDSLRPYHPSSPTFGWGHPENFLYGDSHYWGVWWGHESFEVFNHKVGRFMSEYGFQSMPSMQTIDAFCDKEEQYLFSPTLKTHQKHPTGYETIMAYMKRDYDIPKDLNKFVYVSQVLQAEGMKTAVEAHRRHQPHCMGTLYWQFNDSWFVSSWSSIDYLYRKKALHYYIREAYKDVILSAWTEHNRLNLSAISNDVPAGEYLIKSYQLSFYGDTLQQFSDSVFLEANSSQSIFSKPLDAFKNQKDSYFISEISNTQGSKDMAYAFFDKTKHLNLPKTHLNIEIHRKDSVYELRLFSDVFVKDLALESNIDGEFSENYFCLPAKQTKVLYFYTKEDKPLEISYQSMDKI